MRISVYGTCLDKKKIPKKNVIGGLSRLACRLNFTTDFLGACSPEYL